MTSLPSPELLPGIEPSRFLVPEFSAEISRSDSEQCLLKAFRSFAEAADSLERSYGMLRAEVARLRGELEQSNAGLQRSLEENREMRQHLDRILDGLPCGVLVVKGDGAISRINPEGRRLMGLIENGSGVESFLSVPKAMRDVLQHARSVPGEQEQCIQGRSGEELWLSVRHAAVKDVDENLSPNHSVSIFIIRDVSDVKKMLREREKSRREQALAEMSAVLAHEIRNPLGSLELFAGLLAGAELSPPCRDWVQNVQAGLRTLAATVNNVLHFHSLPAPQRSPIDLGHLIDWAGGFLLPMARQNRVQLCVRNHLQGVDFAADRHRLEQVLLNLVLNSLRAMPGGGWVEISGRRICAGDASVAVITVSDTGPGVAVADAARIFEPGFSTHSGSPGLGLAVCRKIVEQHGGALTVANRSGVGASFTLTFPLPEAVHQKEAMKIEEAQ